MPFLPPNQQRQSTDGNGCSNEVEKPVDWYSVLNTTLAAKALRYENEKLGLLSDMTVQQVTD